MGVCKRGLVGEAGLCCFGGGRLCSACRMGFTGLGNCCSRSLGMRGYS